MKHPRTSKNQIKARRAEKEDRISAKRKANAGCRIVNGIELPPGAVLANWDLLQHNHATIPQISYPAFYSDRPFVCRDCASYEVWTAIQQKWWHETAKGSIDSIAIRCRNCRQKERERIAAARESQLAGRRRKIQKDDV